MRGPLIILSVSNYTKRFHPPYTTMVNFDITLKHILQMRAIAFMGCVNLRSRIKT